MLIALVIMTIVLVIGCLLVLWIWAGNPRDWVETREPGRITMRIRRGRSAGSGKSLKSLLGLDGS